MKHGVFLLEVFSIVETGNKQFVYWDRSLFLIIPVTIVYFCQDEKLIILVIVQIHLKMSVQVSKDEKLWNLLNDASAFWYLI